MPIAQYYSSQHHHDIYMCTWLITTSIELKTFLNFVYAPKTVLLTHRRFYDFPEARRVILRNVRTDYNLK